MGLKLSARYLPSAGLNWPGSRVRLSSQPQWPPRGSPGNGPVTCKGLSQR
jgi:hypothetical protein